MVKSRELGGFVGVSPLSRAGGLLAGARTAAGYLPMLAALSRDLPAFLRHPTTPDQARTIVGRRLETRSERLLRLAEQAIYGHARSPYRRLLRSVGCELGDLRALVAAEGVEGALLRLADLGVYVTIDELRGRSEIVRGSERFRPAGADFDNPGLPAHFERWSSGSRSAGTTVKTSLASVADLAVDLALALEAHEQLESEHVFWMTAPLGQLLRHARVGCSPVAWFYPLKPLPWKVQAAAWYLQVYGRLLGHPLPAPVWSDLRDPARMARWLAGRLMRARSICVRTYASSIARVAGAAQELSIDLRGVCFITQGEPFTESKRRLVEAVGARALVTYNSVETGNIAYGCAEPVAADDVHLLSDQLALIQRPAAAAAASDDGQPFLFTSLGRFTPKILLNYENGDHGLLERRECGCRLGGLGLKDHLSRIGSHEKLTSEGMTAPASRLVRIVEEVLPTRFGGLGADYQLVEEEDQQGVTRLYLLVEPRLGPLDEADVKRAFLSELGRSDEMQEYVASFWRRAETVQVRREAPRVTRLGKTLPLRMAGQGSASSARPEP